MRIFVSAPLPGAAVENLREVGEVVVGDGGSGVRDPRLVEQADTFDALVALVIDHVDAALIARAKRLRVVANVGVGYDNVDLGLQGAEHRGYEHARGVDRGNGRHGLRAPPCGGTACCRG